MNKIFQSQILPVISSKDKNLLKRIFELNHIENTNGRRLHLPLGLTMVRSKTGITCYTAEGIRRIFKTFSSRCTLCLKLDLVDEKLGRYSHRLSDLRLTALLGEENPLWHTVSMDFVGNFTLKQFINSRGKHSSYKCWGLFFSDLASGLSEIQ